MYLISHEDIGVPPIFSKNHILFYPNCVTEQTPATHGSGYIATEALKYLPL